MTGLRSTIAVPAAVRPLPAEEIGRRPVALFGGPEPDHRGGPQCVALLRPATAIAAVDERHGGYMGRSEQPLDVLPPGLFECRARVGRPDRHAELGQGNEVPMCAAPLLVG